VHFFYANVIASYLYLNYQMTFFGKPGSFQQGTSGDDLATNKNITTIQSKNLENVAYLFKTFPADFADHRSKMNCYICVILRDQWEIAIIFITWNGLLLLLLQVQVVNQLRAMDLQNLPIRILNLF
jgi:hypothetical protein